MLGLKLYGKSVQDGVPTPEAPVEIESAGNGGNVTARITGTNLLDFSGAVGGTSVGITATLTGDGGYVMKGTADSTAINIWFFGNYGGGINVFTLYPGTYTCKNVVLYYGQKSFATVANILPNVPYTFKISTNVVITGVRCVSAVAGTTYNETLYPILVRGDSLPEWEPYKSQTLTYPAPNGLPGIPVESGGNYTDENGQQWICDEVDFGRGKYVQRVRIRTVESTDSIQINTSASDEDVNRCFFKCPGKLQQKIGVRCNVLTYSKDYLYNNMPANYLVDEASENVLFGVEKSFGSTPSIIRQNLMDAGAKMLYALATPVETDLTPEQLEEYAALTTYKPNTTVTTDSSPAAGIEVKYVADTGVDVLLTEKQDKLLGETTQLAGFDEDGNLIAREVLPDDIGAIAEPEEGETGQYLQKTDTGASWSDGPDLSDYAKS